MRPRISIRGSVRPYVRMSVCPSVRMSVSILKNRGISSKIVHYESLHTNYILTSNHDTFCHYHHCRRPPTTKSVFATSPTNMSLTVTLPLPLLGTYERCQIHKSFIIIIIIVIINVFAIIIDIILVSIRGSVYPYVRPCIR